MRQRVEQSRISYGKDLNARQGDENKGKRNYVKEKKNKEKWKEMHRT